MFVTGDQEFIENTPPWAFILAVSVCARFERLITPRFLGGSKHSLPKFSIVWTFRSFAAPTCRRFEGSNALGVKFGNVWQLCTAKLSSFGSFERPGFQRLEGSNILCLKFGIVWKFRTSWVSTFGRFERSVPQVWHRLEVSNVLGFNVWKVRTFCASSLASFGSFERPVPHRLEGVLLSFLTR
jgi:hypothetical protein